MTTIKLKNGSGAPTAGDLVQGEPALDLTNKRLYTEDSVGTVIEVGTNPTSVTTGTITGSGDLAINTDTLFVDVSADAVGIGTSSPSTKLHMKQTTDNAFSGLRIERSTTSNQYSVLSSAQGTTYLVGVDVLGAGNNVLSFGNSTNGSTYTERMRIDASGNVGIGTSSPATGLEVGTTNYTFSGTTYDIYGLFGDTSGGIRLGADSSNDDSVIGTTGTNNLQFVTYNGSAWGSRMTLDNTGNVGIGTSSPSSKLHVAGGSTTEIRAVSSGNLTTGAASILRFGGSNSATSGYVGYGGTASTIDVWNTLSGSITFGTANTERMRIDSSGNVLVGGTSTTPWGNGTGTASDNQLVAREDGILGASAYKATASSGYVGYFNRTSTDGGILAFNKNGSTVGSIGTEGGDLTIGNADTGLQFVNTSQIIRPQNLTTNSAIDAQVDLGQSAYRFKDLYLSGQTLGGTGTAGAPTYAFGSDTDMGMYRAANNNLGFSTNGGERMRIDGSGNLLVGRTSAPVTADNGVTLYNTGEIYSFLAGTNSLPQMRFYRDTAGTPVIVGSIQTNGTTTAYNTSSDQRLKDNIVDAPSASDDIDAIQVRSFDWKADGSHQKYGMVAQELQSVAPEAVTGDADSEDMMGVDYSKLVPMLVKEIQSLRARVAQLETN